MASTDFRRSRSDEAKRVRERTILDAATALATDSGIRNVTLTDSASAVRMHKSEMLRYFETREQIFLTLTAEGWREWSSSLRVQLAELRPAAPAAPIASVLGG